MIDNMINNYRLRKLMRSLEQENKQLNVDYGDLASNAWMLQHAYNLTNSDNPTVTIRATERDLNHIAELSIMGLKKGYFAEVNSEMNNAIKEPFDQLIASLCAKIKDLTAKAKYDGICLEGIVMSPDGNSNLTSDNIINNVIFKNSEMLQRIAAQGYDMKSDADKDGLLGIVLMQIIRENNAVIPFYAYSNSQNKNENTVETDFPSSMIEVTKDFSIDGVLMGTPYTRDYGTTNITISENPKLVDLAYNIMSTAGRSVADKRFVEYIKD